MAGPKIHVTGPYLEGQGAFTLQMHQLKDAEDARRTVEFWIAQGVTSFKAYMNITPEELSAGVKAAHARGIKVTGHLCSIGFREAAALGIDDLEHGLVADTEFLPDKKPGECPNPAAANKALLGLDFSDWKSRVGPFSRQSRIWWRTTSPSLRRCRCLKRLCRTAPPWTLASWMPCSRRLGSPI